jgi:hypothetical protein
VGIGQKIAVALMNIDGKFKKLICTDMIRMPMGINDTERLKLIKGDALFYGLWLSARIDDDCLFGRLIGDDVAVDL